MEKTQQSKEDYLETILVLKNKIGYVRSIDVATELGYSKPSISRAMSLLKSQGLITIESNGNIQFTDDGFKQANAVYERHIVLTDFFFKVLGVPEKIAAEDACRVEHIISQEAFDKIKEMVKNK